MKTAEVEGDQLGYIVNEIINAWGLSDRVWIVRRNKMQDNNQYEVVEDWGGKLTSDQTMKVVDGFPTSDLAKKHAHRLEKEGAARRIIEMFQKRPDIAHYLVKNN